MIESEQLVHEPKVVQLDVHEVPLFPAARTVEDAFYVRERPIEAVSRRLNELKLSVDDFARVLHEDPKLVLDVLDEVVAPSNQLFYSMLDVVGLDLVAVRSLPVAYKDDRGGHWCYRERCIYCGVNYYDADLDPNYPVCPNSPFNKTKADN